MLNSDILHDTFSFFNRQELSKIQPTCSLFNNTISNNFSKKPLHRSTFYLELDTEFKCRVNNGELELLVFSIPDIFNSLLVFDDIHVVVSVGYIYHIVTEEENNCLNQMRLIFQKAKHLTINLNSLFFCGEDYNLWEIISSLFDYFLIQNKLFTDHDAKARSSTGVFKLIINNGQTSFLLPLERYSKALKHRKFIFKMDSYSEQIFILCLALYLQLGHLGLIVVHLPDELFKVFISMITIVSY